MLQSDRLKVLRLQKNFTLEHLADLLNLSTRQVSRYEIGEADPASDVVSRMADIFEVSSDFLLGRVDDPTPHAAVANLNEQERAILAALRRNDPIAAIKAIVDGV